MEAEEVIMTFTNINDGLPPEDTPVLLLHKSGVIYEGLLRWEYPSYEENFAPFRYFIDVGDWHCDWEWSDILGWMPKPPLPDWYQPES
jgi:hypothetical protein